MSEEISYCNCSAHGCPMLGTMTRSTTGSKEWYCGIHFGAPAARWGEITHELLRLKWLVDITRALRAGHIGDAHKQMAMNQSSHLKRGDHETLAQWLIRLEKTLHEACQEPAQQELAPQGEEKCTTP